MNWSIQLWQKDLTNQLESNKHVLCAMPVEQSSSVEMYSDCSSRFQETPQQDLLKPIRGTQGTAVCNPTSETARNSVRNSGSLLLPVLGTLRSDKGSVSTSEVSSLKGRMGHLVETIDSHKSSSAGTCMCARVPSTELLSCADEVTSSLSAFINTCAKCGQTCTDDGGCSNCS